MLTKLKTELNAEWNKPKQKNAKEGQPVRSYEKISDIQGQITALKKKE